MSGREVPTRHGPARLHRVARAEAGAPTLVLGHGAGGGIEATDLQELATVAGGAGCGVVLVEQPWRVAGRRVAPRPVVLDECWLDAVSTLSPRGPLVLCGRSAGARVACRTADGLGAAAVLALAFPLHPPGRPERSRAAELVGCPVPLLVVQGERDPFGSPVEVEAAAPGIEVVPVPGADHGLTRGDRSAAWAAAERLLAGLRE
jgi:predicted alpha/beta-hydrolase family hydrolase